MSSALATATQSSSKLTRSQKRKLKAQRQRLRAYQASRAPCVGSRRESLSGPGESKSALTTLAESPLYHEVLTRSTHELLSICSRETERDSDSDEQEQQEPLLEEEEPVPDGWEVVLGGTFCPEEGSTDEPDATDAATADDWELV